MTKSDQFSSAAASLYHPSEKYELSHVWFWNIISDCFLPVSTAERLNGVSVLSILCRPHPLVLANFQVSSRHSHLSIKNCCVAALSLYVSVFPFDPRSLEKVTFHSPVIITSSFMKSPTRGQRQEVQLDISLSWCIELRLPSSFELRVQCEWTQQMYISLL